MSHINISYSKYTYTTDTIGIHDFDLSVPGKELLVNSKLSMCPGRVAQNLVNVSAQEISRIKS